MVTVDFHKLKLPPQSVILDAGCGTGRHLREMIRRPDLKIVGLDTNYDELHKAYVSLQEISGATPDNCLVLKADINSLPFGAGSFDCVICSEVLEHIPEHDKALKELVRVLKPQGTLVISVPRYFPERICWMISPAYYNEKGGHIRIYKKKDICRMLENHGINCWQINYKHALHAPYWWLKCLVGLKNDEHLLVKYYKKFLEWDIMHRPVFVRLLEAVLNPVMGKSIVFYLKKG